MTIDEAIKYVESVASYRAYMPPIREALQMAIGALRAQRDVENKESVSPCDVCIYSPPSSLDGKPCTMCPAKSR